MPTTKSQERHIVVTLLAQAVHHDAVKSLLFEAVDSARDEPGCLYYDIYQDQADANRFFVADGWASDEALAAHLANPDAKRIAEKLTPLLAEPATMTVSQRLSEPR